MPEPPARTIPFIGQSKKALNVVLLQARGLFFDQLHDAGDSVGAVGRILHAHERLEQRAVEQRTQWNRILAAERDVDEVAGVLLQVVRAEGPPSSAK